VSGDVQEEITLKTQGGYCYKGRILVTYWGKMKVENGKRPPAAFWIAGRVSFLMLVTRVFALE